MGCAQEEVPHSHVWQMLLLLPGQSPLEERIVHVPIVYKWKNHFYEMKGDVGMPLHEKGRNKKMPTPRHKVTHNPIPTSLFCFNMLFVCLFAMNVLGKANSTTS